MADAIKALAGMIKNKEDALIGKEMAKHCDKRIRKAKSRIAKLEQHLRIALKELELVETGEYSVLSRRQDQIIGFRKTATKVLKQTIEI